MATVWSHRRFKRSADGSSWGVFVSELSAPLDDPLQVAQPLLAEQSTCGEQLVAVGRAGGGSQGRIGIWVGR